MDSLKAGNPSVHTTCPYCGVGCGVVASPDTRQPVAGDAEHPANQGRLCVKGASLHETTGHEGRLLFPVIRGHRAGWDKAIEEVAKAIRSSMDAYGPESVAFYLSGQLLTEDYYVANKLAKGFIRTPNVDTNSRLCMSSAVAAHKRAFGADVVPGCYEDLELADLLVLAGSNAAWAHPVLYQRMKTAAREGRRVVVIDPRRTATSELADLHLPLRPGTDTVLFNGLLGWLADGDGLDQAYIDHHCQGFGEALASARAAAPDVASVAKQCDLPRQDVETFYRWFTSTPRTVTAFSQGINQSVAGTDKGNAIINCHLATGRVGKPGAGPFSLTGQPNAMGGREVGGLANTLAAHMDYDSPDSRSKVAGFWGTSSVADGPGLKAVDMFEAVHRGDIRVLWIMGTNPAVSLPDSTRVREALALCPTVIVSDCVSQTDTTAHADILLPAAGWGEKDGTVTNSERRISRQRSFLPLPAEVKPDWWIVSSVAGKLGFAEAFDYDRPADIFREHAALSAHENGGERIFNLAGLAGLTDTGYDALEPVQWPVLSGAGATGSSRLFTDGRFVTDDHRARFVAINTILPEQKACDGYPMVVNTGRIRDQWHTMTRTASAPRLLAHRSEPFIEVHPHDMARLKLLEGHLGRLTLKNDHFVGRVRSSGEQRPGEVFIPIHWNRQFASSAVATVLTESVTDPVSGQPEAKHGRASLTPFRASWHGRLLVRRNRPRRWLADYWCHVPLHHCDSWWIAGGQPVQWQGAVSDWLGGAAHVVMADPAQGCFRAARIINGQLEAVLMVDHDPARIPKAGWLDDCFSEPELSESSRRTLLAARDVDVEDPGAIICSCFQVGERQIGAAIADGVESVQGLGDLLRCGTNCGSCIPELRNLIDGSVGERV
ncbi:molybdopterin-dependent oxidoreductase [Marinobacter sp. TBZ242]|uniref:Molybdopterin-dependent oxidoreductase n=1 Tax=Marinobacter azerbaijanicus TaxID=3050455 RepID=A0ABT7IF87_9GAMM|nr:nitrate reductase [Marinobacter sp. TBZ242]MDL0432830.1 molybdopterin-dependent oxidoreductase [Marinobacter sp. TBZ242]